MKGFNPKRERVLFPRHFDNSLSVYHFLEFESQLGKSEKLNNQGMKVNKAFRIPFITKKQLKSRVFAENFLEAPIQSIQRCLNPLFQRIFFYVPSFSKISQPSG